MLAKIGILMPINDWPNEKGSLALAKILARACQKMPSFLKKRDWHWQRLAKSKNNAKIPGFYHSK